ncbi:hypothetical protein [Conexibacter woesei]|uniref:Uncharacterized protein n=1 Tax=Conexibacter woesei (strain DSM 14684 / CCUG 47730 / CIP 108061 / JCM 11494 / NBRC 100937 / ID131577) TaxID=469383 RepID=D3F5Y3_CONWI|nr:hypothetical protein [Conexibacter woesei]ADB52682.1 hypothetical protein Cwoe_4268 [Conexibacter woesei DSM 14684]
MSAKRLEALVGEPLTPALRRHDPAVLGALAEALEAAMAQQRAALEDAVDGAHRAVPRPLRPLVRRMLG